MDDGVSPLLLSAEASLNLIRKNQSGKNMNHLRVLVDRPIDEYMADSDKDHGAARVLAKVLEKACAVSDKVSLLEAGDAWFGQLPAAYSLFLLPDYHESDEARLYEYMAAFDRLCGLDNGRYCFLCEHESAVEEQLGRVLGWIVYNKRFAAWLGPYAVKNFYGVLFDGYDLLDTRVTAYDVRNGVRNVLVHFNEERIVECNNRRKEIINNLPKLTAAADLLPYDRALRELMDLDKELNYLYKGL